MKTIAPFPVTTPFLAEDAAPGRKRPSHPITRWFQQVANVTVPEFANETTQSLTGSTTQFQIPTAAPNPASSLLLYDGTTGALILSGYSVSGQVITFTSAPSGGAPYASYRY